MAKRLAKRAKSLKKVSQKHVSLRPLFDGMKKVELELQKLMKQRNKFCSGLYVYVEKSKRK